MYKQYSAYMWEPQILMQSLGVDAGKAALAVPAYNTSHECFQCGEVSQNLTLEDRGVPLSPLRLYPRLGSEHLLGSFEACRWGGCHPPPRCARLGSSNQYLPHHP